MTVTSTTQSAGPLSERELEIIDAYWRAANYLAVGQIYLLDNPLLREPLRLEHVKPRLLGHWGTTPGLNFVYAHMNRAIVEHDVDAIHITGPGHGGPAIVANDWLDGSYTDVYHNVGQDEEGMRRLFRQFSFPGGIPSHVAAEVPGSIHEGGELGYALVHAFGAAFDPPTPPVPAPVARGAGGRGGRRGAGGGRRGAGGGSPRGPGKGRASGGAVPPTQAANSSGRVVAMVKLSSLPSTPNSTWW